MSHVLSAPRRLLALVPAATLVVALGNLNVPYFAVAPGPAREVGGLIEIDGAKTYPSKGRLLMTTVTLGPLRLGQMIRATLDSTVDVIDRDLIIPPGRTPQQVSDENTQQMQESQAFAAAAALRLLGYEVKVEGAGARVLSVAIDVPAAGVLRAGDVIVAAAGTKIRRSEQLIGVIERAGVGADVELRVKRADDELKLTVRTVERPDSEGDPVIGIAIETVVSDIELPLEVNISSGEVGGPSAGLIFALGIIDTLRERDITGGRVVAGTGVISPDGVVGAVGGVQQKVVGAKRAGAEVFLVPDAELEQACEVAETIVVIGVRTLADALEALEEPASAERTCGPGAGG